MDATWVPQVERQAGELDAVFVDGFESGDTSAWDL
jgi:hypothetical protein